MVNETLQEFVQRVLDKDTLFKYLEDSEKHILLWTYLGENGDKNKEDFFEYFKIVEIDFLPINGCYACKHVNWNCNRCPVVWSDGRHCYSAEYEEWIDVETIEEKSELAFKIANLEWKEKGEQ